VTTRWGLTIPVLGIGLPQHRALVEAMPGWGYTDAWSSEVNGADAFTPLALAAAWEPTLQLGTAIVPAFTRGPALIAQSAATLAMAAPGRFTLGLGASSPAIVEQWNGVAFDEPYRRTRDVLRFVRSALAGDKVSGTFDTFRSSGFKLEQAPATQPRVLLAALRPRMLALAGREADGVILNWLAASDVSQCLDALGNPSAEVVARIFVCPTDNADYARMLGRRLISSYLTVGAYAEFHRWLGRGTAFGKMWELWAAGDRAGAGAAIPDEVVDSLVLHGSVDECRKQVQDYADAGVGVPVMAVLPTPDWTSAENIAATLGGLGGGAS